MNALAPCPETKAEPLAAMILAECPPDSRPASAKVVVTAADGAVVAVFDVPLSPVASPGV